MNISFKKIIQYKINLNIWESHKKKSRKQTTNWIYAQGHASSNTGFTRVLHYKTCSNQQFRKLARPIWHLYIVKFNKLL